MISDVLSDAAFEIRRYQKEMPDFYEQSRDRIDKVVAAMDALRIFFDTPPPEEPTSREDSEYE
jgi:hypothetical protein